VFYQAKSIIIAGSAKNNQAVSLLLQGYAVAEGYLLINSVDVQ
jgi:hypothetical protein